MATPVWSTVTTSCAVSIHHDPAPQAHSLNPIQSDALREPSAGRRCFVTAICGSISSPSAGCQKGFVAYIDRVPNTHRIVFCQRYFGSPKTDQKVTKLYADLANVDLYHAGVMLHEFTHLSAWDAAITIDKRYDNDRVIKLGKRHPDKAVDNADSYHFFVIRGFFTH